MLCNVIAGMITTKYSHTTRTIFSNSTRTTHRIRGGKNSIHKYFTCGASSSSTLSDRTFFNNSKSTQRNYRYFSTGSSTGTDSSSSSSKEEKKKNKNSVDDPYQGYNLSLRQRRALKLVNSQQQTNDDNKNNDDNDDNSSSNDQDEQNMDQLTDITQALKILKEQSEIQDLEQYETNPLPWYNLLTHPSRALWRSSPKLPPPYLTNAQFDIIKKSERTSKQLRRTIENIVKNHVALSGRRERERRRMVNDINTGASTSLDGKKMRSMDNKVKPVFYKPEQTVSSLKYRLVPNYNLTKRILRETQSLIGKDQFQPKKVLDVGIGVGSASAALLDYSFERWKQDNVSSGDSDGDGESMNNSQYRQRYDGVEWIHGIDPSLSMREGAERVLNSVMEGQEEELKMDDTSTSTSRAPKKPRITLGETLSPSVDRNILRSRGTYDLALCSFTLNEIPSIVASLSLAATTWEKLSPNGIAIFIEPGTPDGFNSLRAVRSMLLDCCPPTSEDGDVGENVEGDEECHVIAPCTHNGTCPMVRHQRFFFKKNKKAEGDTIGNEEEMLKLGLEDLEGLEDIDEDWLGENGSDSEEGQEEEDFDMHEWEEDLIDLQHGEEDEQISQSSPDSKSKTPETDVFNTAFCSFVHGMPGGEHGKRGEKFSYLVLQKRITGEIDVETVQRDDDDQFKDVNIVELLSRSIDTSGVNLPRAKQKMKNQSAKNNEKMKDVLTEARDIERKFLYSEEDLLGLELVKGKHTSWGRIVRAPIKKKGHVVVDYCTSGSVEDEEDLDEFGQVRGKIIRQKVTRSQSERAAPGMYLASRKSRWGGLWPDLEKVKSSS